LTDVGLRTGDELVDDLAVDLEALPADGTEAISSRMWNGEERRG
jgi:hypothetical protein